jgi:hypothetical protein
MHGLLLFLLLWAGQHLGACGQAATGSAPTTLDPPAGPVLRTRDEGADVSACGPLWPESGTVTLRGLYRTSGDEAYIDAYRGLAGESPCWSRFFLDPVPELGVVSWEAPRYVEVTGRVSTIRWSSPGLWDLQVDDWSLLPFDPEAVGKRCQRGIADHADDLRRLDWERLSFPAFYTGTASFEPLPDSFGTFRMTILGADDRQPMVLLAGEGPELPPVRPLVRRWIAVDCVYDLDEERVVQLIATIRGELQE